MERSKAQNIDEYIAAFAPDVREKLQQMRALIRKAAPEAEEAISYAIPAYKLKGNLVFFAAFRNHISLYPAPRGDAGFSKLLARYEGGKGTVQFPYDKPLPASLITKIVKFRVNDNLERARAKQLKGKRSKVKGNGSTGDVRGR